MTLVLRFGLVLAVVALASGCSRGRQSEHGTERRHAELPPPTPDTTPIAALRTPAGLVLGVEGTPVPPAPSPAQSPIGPAATPTPPNP